MGVLSAVSSWGETWQEGDLSKLSLKDWTIAVVTADSQLYRWKAQWTVDGKALMPPGFLDVYQAFMTLAR